MGIHIEDAKHHVYVHADIQQSTGSKEMHEALLDARWGEDVQADIMEKLDVVFQIRLLEIIDQGGVWADGTDLGTIQGTAGGDDGEALPLVDSRQFWQSSIKHYYAAPEREHDGRRAMQNMTRLNVLTNMVK